MKATAADTKAKAKELGDLLGDPGKKDEAPKSAQVRLASLTQSDIVNAMRGRPAASAILRGQIQSAGHGHGHRQRRLRGKSGECNHQRQVRGLAHGLLHRECGALGSFSTCQAMTFPWPFTLSPR